VPAHCTHRRFAETWCLYRDCIRPLSIQVPDRDVTARKARFPRLNRHPRAKVPEKVGYGSLAILHLYIAISICAVSETCQQTDANFERYSQLHVAVFFLFKGIVALWVVICIQLDLQLESQGQPSDGSRCCEAHLAPQRTAQLGLQPPTSRRLASQRRNVQEALTVRTLRLVPRVSWWMPYKTL
jgi:hypothetical protein